MRIPAVLALLFPLALAHAPVSERPEVYPETQTRLFVLDNRNAQVVALDLPRGEVVARLSIPPKGMSMAATPSGRYLLVSRGRDTDRQWLTVIWTGREEGWRRPVVAKSLLLGRGLNISHGPKAYTLVKSPIVFAERDGLAHRFSEEVLEPSSAFHAETLKLPSPDHYHLVEAPEGVYLTLLRMGQVLLYADPSLREEKARFPCPVEHGEGFDPVTGRSFFACARDVLVLEGGREVTRLAYPVQERIGAFLKGEGVYFGYSDGVTHLQRLDPRGPSLTPVPLGGRYIGGASDGSRLLVLLTDGRLQLREAREGRLLREIRLARPFPEMDEDTGGAILPDIALGGERAYVSLPHLGLVAELGLDPLRVLRFHRVGGMPTRLVLIP
ncbi:MAG: YncE family protein [Thermaceae bacterium]